MRFTCVFMRCFIVSFYGILMTFFKGRNGGIFAKSSGQFNSKWNRFPWNSLVAQNQNEQNSKKNYFERPKNVDIQLIIYRVDNIDLSRLTVIDNLSPQIWRIWKISPKKTCHRKYEELNKSVQKSWKPELVCLELELICLEPNLISPQHSRYFESVTENQFHC